VDARSVVLTLYFGVLAVLTLYGAHRWYLLWLFARHRKDAPRPSARFPVAPRLTVQVPVFNERYVVLRVIDAVAAIDWPADRLDIQILDDSTDDTAALAAAAVAAWRARGIDIVHLRRAERAGYKAGALSAGLAVAKGEFVAVFDADFVPAPDIARLLIDHFTDPGVGMVQARWGHLNRESSLLTRAQSMFLDGHFVIEHMARNRSGRFFNFNGTAGIWRRSCIDAAGGWQHDTLTEDLDLSYRAQLAGWRFVFVDDAVVPAELPVEVGSFKSQQHRWAQGSAQTAVKLLPRILRSSLPRGVKIESVFHLTANVGYVLMVALTLLIGPAVWFRRGIGARELAVVDLPLIATSLVSIAAFYLVSQREAYGSWRGALRYVPVLMAVGIGISINNARAVVAGLTRRETEFRRTPKYALDAGDGALLATRRYRARLGPDTWIELAVGFYFAGLVVAALAGGLWGAVPFLSLFAGGFLYTAGAALGTRGIGPHADSAAGGERFNGRPDPAREGRPPRPRPESLASHRAR